MITLKSGATMSGLLVEHDPEQYVFGLVKVLQPNGSWEQAADGRVYLDRVNVEYVQQISVVADAAQ